MVEKHAAQIHRAARSRAHERGDAASHRQSRLQRVSLVGVPGEVADPPAHAARRSSATGDFVIAIEVTANAFLHHMVRNIAGLLIAIGQGERRAGVGAGSA